MQDRPATESDPSSRRKGLRLEDNFGLRTEDNSPQIVTCRVDELRPHPSYVRHQLSVSAAQLSALATLGSLVFREPIVTNRNGTIIDGYARWDLARHQDRQTILCLEYDLTEQEALQWLIQSHRPSRGLSAFHRVLLALDLEPSLQELARSNQRIGGQNKGLANLTEAQRVDVRSDIAAIAGVSSGNVTKVRQVMKSAHPQIQQAARSGEISIHMAWKSSRLQTEQQLSELEEYRSRKGTNLTSRRLIQKHVARLSASLLVPRSLGHLITRATGKGPSLLNSIAVTEIDAPGNVAYLTKGASVIVNQWRNQNA
jgi:hypothetical protein